MMATTDLRRRAQTALLALATGIAASGCVAAGFATSPLVSAVQLVGDRSVERTVTADKHEAWAAVESALDRMGFRVESRDRADGDWRLRSAADRVTVVATLEGVTSRVTRVTVRVETGGLLADRHTAVAIHDEISKELTAAATGRAAAPAAAAIPGEAMTSLETEVRRLRTEMDERSAAGRVPATETTGAPAWRVQPSAVVTVPLSAALPSVPGPVPMTTVVQPAAVVPPIAAGAPAAPEPVTPPARGASIGTDRTAPLAPAEPLAPIGPNAPGSGK